MPEETSLLAHLVPRMTSRIEDTATDALAFILNKSEACQDALNHLLRGGDLNLEPVVRFQTQVTYEDGSRPDMNGYDKSNRKRLLVESKFWHSLTEGQASGYLDQLDEDGPGVLMFVAPESRIEILWGEISTQIINSGLDLREVATPNQDHRAIIGDSDKRLVLTSWDQLIRTMSDAARSSPSVDSDIHQLMSLATQGDLAGFHPINRQQLSADFPRLIVSLVGIVDDALNRGFSERWIYPQGSRWTKDQDNYSSGWFLRISSGRCAGWFGIYFDLWARGDCDDTPLWLQFTELDLAALQEVSRKLGVRLTSESYFPIAVKTGVLRDEVLDDVVAQLKKISEAIEPYA